MNRLIAGLLAGSALFLVWSSLEFFVLTPIYGPQMVFMSVIHTWPTPAVLAFFFSWLCYILLVPSLVLATVARWMMGNRSRESFSDSPTPTLSRARRLFRWWAGPPGWRRLRNLYVTTALVILHLVAGLTYYVWSDALFG